MATLEELMKDLNVARRKHRDAILFGSREDMDDAWATVQMLERMIAERSERRCGHTRTRSSGIRKHARTGY